MGPLRAPLMNWLAHLYLSDSTPAFRIGNLLPDLAPVVHLRHLREEYQRGITQHLHIDAFTDSHPIVHRSIARVPAPYRRYASILIDVFYDHFLARDWSTFSNVPLADFAAEVYASFEPCRAELPPEVYQRLAWMKEGDLFCSYRHLEGITHVLERLGRRFRRPVELAGAISILDTEGEALRQDFAEFFPALREHLRPRA